MNSASLLLDVDYQNRIAIKPSAPDKIARFWCSELGSVKEAHIVGIIDIVKLLVPIGQVRSGIKGILGKQ